MAARAHVNQPRFRAAREYPAMSSEVCDPRAPAMKSTGFDWPDDLHRHGLRRISTSTCPHITSRRHGQEPSARARRPVGRAVAPWLAALLIAVCAPLASAGWADARTPVRIASVNLCSDQLLIALAEPAQILAVGPLAADPVLSFLAAPARSLPRIANSAEALLRNPPDLLLLGRHDRPHLAGALQRRGVRLATIDHWPNIEETMGGVRYIASVLERPAAGERLVSDIARALADLRELRPRTFGVTFLILHKRGFVESQGVLRNALEEAGLMMARLPGGRPWSFATAEAILGADPDILVAPQSTGRPADLGDAFLEHRALTKAFPPDRRLLVPQSYALCPGPSTPALLDHVRASLLGKLAAGGLHQR